MSYPFSINSVLVRSDGQRFTFKKLSIFCTIKQTKSFINLHHLIYIKQKTIFYTCVFFKLNGSTVNPNVCTGSAIQPSLIVVLPSASKCLCCDWPELSQLAVVKPWDIKLWREPEDMSVKMFCGD